MAKEPPPERVYMLSTQSQKQARRVASRHVSAWRTGPDTDYKAIQEALDSLTPQEWAGTARIDKATRDAFRELTGTHLKKVVTYIPLSRTGLDMPPKALRGNINSLSLTLYRGTNIVEWEEAVSGKITHPFKYEMFKQYGGEVKYLTDNLEYAQNGRWGGSVLAFKFSGKLLGPLKKNSPLIGYVDMVAHLGGLRKELASLADGLYGFERGVGGITTYGVWDLSKLTVDIAESRRLKDTARDAYI